MEALQFDPVHKELSIKKLPKPTIENDDDVIVEVAYCGLCGTDLHIIQGEFPCSPKPFIPGHEFSGIVRETGPAVTHVKPGDRIAMDPQNWCTTCEYCTTSRYHLCCEGGVDLATGIFFNGGFAKYSKIRARQVYKLPPSLSLKQGAMTEPFSCMVWALKRGVQATKVGSTILITGAGIIGNFWSSVLHHMGHRRVVVCEPSPIRRVINQKIETGFECVSPEELKAKIEQGWSADLAIDCSGNGAAISQALSCLKPGGQLCIFGVAAPDTKISVSPFEIYKKELTIFGCNINPFSMKDALGLMESMGPRYLDYNRLGVKEFQLTDYKQAISELQKTQISKVIFQINPNLE